MSEYDEKSKNKIDNRRKLFEGGKLFIHLENIISQIKVSTLNAFPKNIYI